jgi:hypothetical protein
VTEKYEFIESLRIDEGKYAYPVAFMCERVAEVISPRIAA